MTRLLLALILGSLTPAALAESDLVQQGIDQLNRGAYSTAVSTLRKAVIATPSDLQARRYLCSALLSSGQATASAQQLEIIVKFAPGNNSDLCMLADSYFLCGESEKSAECYKKALRSDPSNVTASYGLSRALLAVGDLAAAQDLALHTIRSTTNPKIRGACAQILSQIKQRSLVQSGSGAVAKG